MTPRQRELHERRPRFAVVVRDGLYAVVAETAVFPHEGDQLAAAAGQDGNFAELVALVERHQDFIAPRLPLIVGVPAELGQMFLERIMSGDDPAPGVEFEEFVRHDAAERRFDRFAPSQPLVGRKVQNVDRVVVFLLSYCWHAVDDHRESPVAQRGDACAVVAVRQPFRAFGERAFRSPSPPLVGRFRQHDPRVGTVAVVGAFGEDANELAGFGQSDIRPRFVERGIVADSELFDIHGAILRLCSASRRRCSGAPRPPTASGADALCRTRCLSRASSPCPPGSRRLR